MKILVDSKGMHSKGGIGRDAVYFLEFVINSLNNLDAEIDYSPKYFQKLSRKYVTLRGLLRFGIQVPKRKADVFIENNFSGRRVKNDKILHIVRVHDIFPISNPNWFRKVACKVFASGFKASIRHGKTIYVCNSHTTRQKLLSLNSNLENKSIVLHCNAEHIRNIENVQCPCKGCTILENLDLAAPYFVMVGTIEPRKNYEFILDVIRRNKLAIKIIVIGRPGWKSKKTQKLLRGDSRVDWVPDCCDSALQGLYLKSIAFLSTSHDEGFNLPAAEAVILGKNVILPKSAIYDELYGKTYFKYSHESELIALLTSIDHFKKITSKFEFNHFESKKESRNDLLLLIQSYSTFL